MKLYLTRHGQTEMNTIHCLQGRTDTELNETGRQQAQEMHTFLASKQMHFDHVLVSPLKRVKQTASLMTGLDASQLIEEPRLIEMSFGVNEGQRLKDLPASFYETFFQDPRYYIAPDGADTYADAFDRIVDLIEDLRCGELHEKYKDASILLVSHGATTHCILQYLAHTPFQDMWKITVDNCAFLELHLSQEPYTGIHQETPGIPYSKYNDSYEFVHPGFSRPLYQPE